MRPRRIVRRIEDVPPDAREKYIRDSEYVESWPRVSSRLLPGAGPTHNLTFRATDKQHEDYRRVASLAGARTLTEWITRSLDAIVAAADEAERHRTSKRSK